MDISYLFAQQMPVPSHAVLAFAAILVGGLQFAFPKGTMIHKGLGYLWVGAMLYVAGSALFIHEIRLIGPFSPIHLLSFLVFASLWVAMRAVWKGNVSLHKKTMIALYIQALIITGGFTLIPGRVMHQVVFGG